MAEAYEELLDDNYRYQRRAKKRKKSLEALDKKKTKLITVGRKTVFTVKVITSGKEETFDIPANKYIGHPDEFKEIKQVCIKKYGEGVQILNIVTR